MAGATTLAYYDMAPLTALKGFMVQAVGVHKTCVRGAL
jgi:hypothetical protein